MEFFIIFGLISFVNQIVSRYGEDKVINRNPEEQKWYYTSVYNSCIEGADKEHPVFKRYKKVLDAVFEN